MTPSGARTRDLAVVGAAVAEVLERVFATVVDVRAAAMRPAARESLRAGSPVLDDGVRKLLLAPGQLAVGLGLVPAPKPEPTSPVRLEWWQVDPRSGAVGSLEPDLRPASMGYYDYTAAEWFDVPRRSGARHVVGPYVDVHGTGRYLLTFTEPGVVDAEFLGVAGADVPVSRFEGRLLQTLGRTSAPFLLVNDEDRIVLSTSSRCLVGSLLRDGTGPGPVARIPGVPWRLALVEGKTPLPG